MHLRTRDTLGTKSNILDAERGKLKVSKTHRRGPSRLGSGGNSATGQKEGEGQLELKILGTSTHREDAPFMQSTPLGRPRRKPRLPQGRSAAQSAQVSSSLPPSSPLQPTSEDLRPAAVELNELPISEEEDVLDEVEDPFGFLAAERKLKKRRGQSERPAFKKKEIPEQLTEDNIDDLYASEEVEAFAKHELPQEKEKRFTEESTPRPPATPHKRAVKRRSMDTPCSTPGTASMASTPSPSKPAKSSELAPGNSRSSGFHAIATTQGRGRKKLRIQPVQRSEYDEILDPVEYAKKLEGMLPKRHVKRNAAAGSKRASRRVRGKVRDEETSSEDEPVQKHKPSAKVQGKRKASGTKVKGESIDIEPEDAERRQERLAYFQKLNGYELQKENVYVV